MEENNKNINVVTKKFITGFSDTSPEETLFEILNSFIENITVYDYRGTDLRESPYEGWAVALYLSNRHLWVFVVETDRNGYIKTMKVAKYSYDIVDASFLPEEINFKLVRKVDIPFDTEEARLISELFDAKLPGEVR